jgi:hypothetical protein
MITAEDLARLVAGPFHGDLFGDAGVQEVADARPAEIMRIRPTTPAAAQAFRQEYRTSRIGLPRRWKTQGTMRVPTARACHRRSINCQSSPFVC